MWIFRPRLPCVRYILLTRVNFVEFHYLWDERDVPKKTRNSTDLSTKGNVRDYRLQIAVSVSLSNLNLNETTERGVDRGREGRSKESKKLR